MVAIKNPKFDRNAKLHVRIYEVGTVIYENEHADAFSSENEAGPFDILPFHANFIAILQKKIVVHEAGGRKKEIPIDRGLLRVSRNLLEVFLGISTVDQSKAPAPGSGPAPGGGSIFDG